jgi:hypothetical protein
MGRAFPLHQHVCHEDQRSADEKLCGKMFVRIAAADELAEHGWQKQNVDRGEGRLGGVDKTCLGVGEGVGLQPHRAASPEVDDEALADFKAGREFPSDQERRKDGHAESETRDLQPRGEKQTRNARHAGRLLDIKHLHQGGSSAPIRRRR